MPIAPNYNRKEYEQPIVTGPRPKVKELRKENGITVKVYESPTEMKVRMEGLRERWDHRSAERILDGEDDVWAHPRSKCYNYKPGE